MAVSLSSVKRFLDSGEKIFSKVLKNGDTVHYYRRWGTASRVQNCKNGRKILTEYNGTKPAWTLEQTPMGEIKHCMANGRFPASTEVTKGTQFFLRQEGKIVGNNSWGYGNLTPVDKEVYQQAVNSIRYIT